MAVRLYALFCLVSPCCKPQFLSTKILGLHQILRGLRTPFPVVLSHISAMALESHLVPKHSENWDSGKVLGLDFTTSLVVRSPFNCTKFKAQWTTLAYLEIQYPSFVLISASDMPRVDNSDTRNQLWQVKLYLKSFPINYQNTQCWHELSHEEACMGPMRVSEYVLYQRIACSNPWSQGHSVLA